MNKSWNMYAHENINKKTGKIWFTHTGDKKWVELHMIDKPIVAVKVTIDDKGTYWGWLYSKRGKPPSKEDKPSMIYHDKRLLEMCFPYGLEIEEKNGRGKAVSLTVIKREE